MKTVSYSELRNNLKSVMDMVCDSHEPVIVVRKNGERTVVLSYTDYSSLHSLSRSNMSERLHKNNKHKVYDINLVNSMIKKYSGRDNYIPVKNISMDIETEERIYKLIRLNDDQFYLLYKNSISIFEDYTHLMSLSMDKDIIYSSFSKMYITLKDLFGESGKYYDDWKGCFSFPFLIHFQKDDEIFGYLMNVCNVRSSIEFKIAKLIHADDKQLKRDIIHKPFEDFPREEMSYLINYFIGFLTGYFEYIKNSYDEFFIKTVESNLILFGYKDGRYFDKQYESEGKFRRAIQKLKTR